MNLNGQTTSIGALAQHWNAVLLSFRGIAAFGAWSWEPSLHFSWYVQNGNFTEVLWWRLISFTETVVLSSLQFHQDSARGCNFDLSPDGGLALYPPGGESRHDSQLVVDKK